MFRKVMSKHSDRRKVVKRSTTDYQANLLIVIPICTWIGWTLDEQRSNKTKSHTEEALLPKHHPIITRSTPTLTSENSLAALLANTNLAI